MSATAASRAPLAPTARQRLIVALDAPDVATAERWVERLADSVEFYKVGMELIYGCLLYTSDAADE